MKKYLFTSFLICGHLFAETDSVKSEDVTVSVPDLRYEDDEEMYRQIFGHVEEQEDMLFDAPVLVDGEESGVAPTLVSKTCKVQAAALKNCLTNYLEQDDIPNLDQFKDENGFVDLKRLKEVSLNAKFNRLTMQVEISLPIDKKKERSLGYRCKSRGERPNVEPAKLSAAMNIRASQSFDQNQNSSSNRKNLVLTPYVNIFGICVEGETTYESSSNEKGKFHRAYTTAVYDWEKYDTKFKYGDIFSSSLSYQSPPHIWGFGIRKEVEREKSQGFSTPIRVTILRTSTVEIYSNGHLIRSRTNVSPGTYTLDDISYRNGENDIKIKIIDDTGREETIDESSFYESSFVPKGKFTFGGSYGYPEVNDPINGRYDKKNPLLSMNCRYGLLHSVEIGAGILKTKEGKTLSYEIKNKNMLGNFDLKFATSNYKQAGRKLHGKVYYGNYTAPSINLFDKTNLSFSASIEKSDNFFKPYLAANDSSEKFQENFGNLLNREENISGKNTTVTYHASLSNILTCSTGFSYSRKKTYDNRTSKNFSWNISRGFSIDNDWFSGGNISANFSRNTESNGSGTKSFSLYCSLSLKNHINLSSGYTKTDNDRKYYMSASHSPEHMGFGYDVTAEKSSEGNGYRVNTNYTNPIFRGNLNHSRGSNGSRSTNIGVESSVYFADGRYAIARGHFSDGGFVIVTPKGDLAEHKIKFLNHDDESGFFGGGMVLSNSATSVNVSRLDLKDIPDNISLKQDTVVSKGQYKRGFISDIHGTKSVTAHGILVDSDGAPLEQVTGYAINKDDSDKTPSSFFTNSDGEFSLTDVQPGRYKLVLNVKNVSDLQIEIKETSEDNEFDLGRLTVENANPTEENLVNKISEKENSHD